jgi:hypothetical protein
MAFHIGLARRQRSWLMMTLLPTRQDHINRKLPPDGTRRKRDAGAARVVVRQLRESLEDGEVGAQCVGSGDHRPGVATSVCS